MTARNIAVHPAEVEPEFIACPFGSGPQRQVDRGGGCRAMGELTGGPLPGG